MYWHVDSIGTLDPVLCEDGYDSFIINHLFSGLVELTADMDIIPSLAQAWEVSNDGCRYVFRLRESACWSDGVLVTAGDFEYAWKRAIDPNIASPNAESFFSIKGARAFHDGNGATADVGVWTLDDQTLVVELEEADGHFLYVLATTAAYAIPRHVVEAHGDNWCTPETIITNGPFQIKPWTHDEPIVLVRNPSYFGLFGGNLSRIELTLPPQQESADSLDRYDADLHDIGWMDSVEIDLARQVASHADEYALRPVASVVYIVFDTSAPPFDDVRMRQAFVHAVDRVALVEAVFQGAFVPALGGLVPPGLPGHSSRIGLTYDLDRAKWLMAKAGYPEGRGLAPVSALTRYEGAWCKQSLLLQWSRHLGINLVWETIRWDEYYDRLDADCPNLHSRGLWASHPDPGELLRIVYDRYSRWHDARYEQ